MISITSKQFQNPSAVNNNHMIKQQPSKIGGFKKRSNYLILSVVLAFSIWLLAQMGMLSFVGASIDKIWEKVTYHAGFRLQYVYLNHKEAQNNTLTNKTFSSAQQEVLKAAGLEGSKPGQKPLMAFSTQEIKNNLDSLAWVKSSSVKKVLPDSLYLTIETRQPFVVVETDNKVLVYDSIGNVLPVHPVDVSSDLLRLTGEGAFESAVDLLNIVADSPDLFSEIELARRVSDRRWDIYLKNGLLVKMPENYSTYAWQEITRLAQQNALFDYNVKVVDLRIDDRVTIQGQNTITQ